MSSKKLVQFLLEYDEYLKTKNELFYCDEFQGDVTISKPEINQHQIALEAYVNELKEILIHNINFFSPEEIDIIRSIVDCNNIYRKCLLEGKPNQNSDRWFWLRRDFENYRFEPSYGDLVVEEARKFESRTSSEIQKLLNLYAKPESKAIQELDYIFPERKLEDDITKIINLTYQEVLEDYKNKCYISAISLCGKIIETVLTSLFIKVFKKNPDEEKLGFDAMLNRLKKTGGYEFGELNKQMSLISAHRNKAIHGSIIIPTEDEARGIISLTKDVMLKVVSKT